MSGTGIVEAVAASNDAAANQLSRATNVSRTSAESIEAPLDQYLAVGVPDADAGRMAVLATIETPEAQAVAIASAADCLGVDVG